MNRLSNTWVLCSFTDGSPQKHVLGTFFENGFPPKGWQEISILAKIVFGGILSIVQWLYPFPHASPMQKAPQIHLNMPPTCFVGPQGRKIGFRDPGPENRVQVLLNLVRRQYIYI